ncbi:YtzI protein [Thalassobacillus pellis]|uniref:YtzI protein n=1 Tax=Thalassobacillus pellis TaxID=748008 RepID=UPI001EF8835C|nr:YtzI protein [Thalassobacillus pellis]
MIVTVLIVLGIAAAFAFAINSGYNYKHTVDPLPEEEDDSSINPPKDHTDR